jgi:hypothetical protein
MENKNDKCMMVIAYYKKKNNMPLFSGEERLYKNLFNAYGNVEELKDVRAVEMYLFENNYLIKQEDGSYTVSRIGENAFKTGRFSSEHKKRIVEGLPILLSVLSFILSLIALCK